ncbi:hypothetical protein KW789_02085 [Candidatus Saccharibacteria bacterium]|jgi:hypothetical protein|nr:hypothetical protein [Candidatus Saccharibacteria bacterium]
MEFMSRGGRAQGAGGHSHQKDSWGARTVRFELFVVIVGAALLLAAVALYVGLSGGTAGEQKQIDKNKYQAVFLNGGATSGSVAYTTYFGHVSKLNDKYFVLKDVYYLTTDQTNSSGQVNPQLTKLGCQQLHSPYDEMVINRSQVAFWENLQDSGKVVQAIKQFRSQNPNGPNCTASTTNSTNSPTSNGTTQNSGTTTGR